MNHIEEENNEKENKESDKINELRVLINSEDEYEEPDKSKEYKSGFRNFMILFVIVIAITYIGVASLMKYGRGTVNVYDAKMMMCCMGVVFSGMNFFIAPMDDNMSDDESNGSVAASSFTFLISLLALIIGALVYLTK